MKKLLAILLALGLVLVSFAALAEGPETEDLGEKIEKTIQLRQSHDANAPKFTKTYDTNVTGIVPTETLTFTVTAAETNPGTEVITVGTNKDNKLSVVAGTASYDVPVNLPDSFAKPGLYTYTVKEVAGTSQGTKTYDTTEITVDVYVIYDTSAGAAAGATTVLGTNVYTKITGEGENATKEDEIKNVYEVGNLTVSKVIEGNLADASLDFTIEVKFTATEGKTVNSDITFGTATTGTVKDGETTLTNIAKGWTGTKTVSVVVKGDQKVVFENIPAGVTYTVEEKKAGTANLNNITNDNATQLANANDKAAYTMTSVVTDGTIAKGDSDTAVITNYKGIEVPTGITLDFVPYVMIIALAGIALMALKARKKEN